MATREPPVELFYDPDDLHPTAPRLYVWRNAEVWRLEDEAGTLLSIHPTQDAAIDAALDLSTLCFSEILARGSNGRIEWRIDQDPELLRAARAWRTERLQDLEAAD
jgi:hypothetical protein